MPDKTRILLVLLLPVLFFVQHTHAQEKPVDLAGIVVDSTQTGLPGATVVTLSRPDSVIAQFTTTDSKGAFRLRRHPQGEYILQVTFVGYQAFRKGISIGSSDMDAGRIVLRDQLSELGEVVVSADHIPFVVNQDTLEYNANAFNTRINASVEDLLRRLPGIEIASDGTITAQGEVIENVLVDGKEFFGSDPTIATKNLPAEAIDKIKVYDKKSDKAELTGVEDGEEQKTINLQLKEEAKKGAFGSFSGAFGGESMAQGRYDTEGNLNRFSPTTQLSIVGSFNNISQPAFGYGGFGGVPRNFRPGGGTNDGFSESVAVGVNGSHDFKKRSWIRGSYFVSSLDSRQDQFIRQQQLLGSEISSLANQTNRQQNNELSHKINLNAQHEFDEGHRIRLRSNFNSNSSSESELGLRQTSTFSGDLQNTSDTDYQTELDNTRGSGQLTWSKRFTEEGQSITGQAEFSLSDTDMSGDLKTITGIFDTGDIATYEEVIQQQSRFSQTLEHEQRLSFTQPLSKEHTVELYGEHRTALEDQNKSFFDLIDDTAVFNDRLSSGFDQTYRYWSTGFNVMQHIEDKSWIRLALKLQSSRLEGEISGRNEAIKNRYLNLLPSLNAKVTVKKGKHLDFRYSASTREPSMTELQPFTDNNNPLRLYTGNPDLLPEYRHNLRASYRSFNQATYVNLFTSFSLSYTRDDITLSRAIDEQFRQLVMPINTSNSWEARHGIQYGTPINALGLRFNLGNTFRYDTGTEFINSAPNDSWIIRNSFNIGLENKTKDVFDINTGAQFTFNHINYSLNEELNQSYINSTYSVKATYFLNEAWYVDTSFNLRVYDQDVFGERDNVALLQATISYTFLRDRAEVQLTGLDLLNQNQGVRFSNSATYIEEQRVDTIGRYVLLKFIYRVKGA